MIQSVNNIKLYTMPAKTVDTLQVGLLSRLKNPGATILFQQMQPADIIFKPFKAD